MVEKNPSRAVNWATSPSLPSPSPSPPFRLVRQRCLFLKVLIDPIIRNRHVERSRRSFSVGFHLVPIIGFNSCNSFAAVAAVGVFCCVQCFRFSLLMRCFCVMLSIFFFSSDASDSPPPFDRRIGIDTAALSCPSPCPLDAGPTMWMPRLRPIDLITFVPLSILTSPCLILYYRGVLLLVIFVK